jgi:DNA-binding MarR family transcriptional regulator
MIYSDCERQVVNVLKKNKGKMQLKEIKDFILGRQAVSSTLHRLYIKGLVDKERSKKSLREVVWFLTPKHKEWR